MKLSNYVIDFLVSNNVTHLFEVCGGAITHLLDSLYGRTDIATVSMHHEQAAAFAAEGYARLSGNVGVAMATSGPGATNLITGIASCYFDSIPCLFITGQVNTYEFKFDIPVRQMGFQETDIVKIVKPIVKDALIVTAPEKIKFHLEKSIKIAKSNRPGPVLLDIPMNIQRADIDPNALEKFNHDSSNKINNQKQDKDIFQIAKLISHASRPIVLAGGGVRLSNACEELFELVSKTGIPIVTSLMGLDAFPHDHEAFTGMIGSYGNRYANLAIANADLILALGTRFDTRQTGMKPETFARGAKIIHVDVDPNELNHKIKADFPINCDIKIFLRALNEIVGSPKGQIRLWQEKIVYYKKKYPSYRLPVDEIIEPNYFMTKLSKILPDEAIVCADVGQNQMWSAQSLNLKKDQRFITQGGMGAMGSALPLAIGASFAKPGKTVVVITGDGGFQLNIQELETIYHYQLPIKIILLNNQCYGMVRQFQEQYMEGRFQSTKIGYSCPNFEAVVSSYQIPAMKISSAPEIDQMFKEFFGTSEPAFLEVTISPDALVLPKLAVNKPLEDQDPPLSREELKSNMFIDILPENKESSS